MPLREITLKRLLFFLSPPLMRAHEYAFTFGSSTSTFFQLHIVNCTGLGGKKGKSGGSHLTIRALQVRRRTPTAVKTGVSNVNPAMACSILLWSLSAFAFYHQDYTCPRVGLQLVPCVYLYQVQYDLQNLLYHITCCVNHSQDNDWRVTLFVLLHYFALLKLLSLDCYWSGKHHQTDRT